MFIRRSVLDIHTKEKGFFDDELFNYFLSVSILVLTIWTTYYVVRKRLVSRQLVWAHLIAALVTIFSVPWTIMRYYNSMPKRYYDYDDSLNISNFFGSMTASFFIVLFLLTASEAFLLVNIQRRKKRY
ncbi:MAG: hypothetical protein ABIN93_18605 [Ginsengibacter sp.]